MSKSHLGGSLVDRRSALVSEHFLLDNRAFTEAVPDLEVLDSALLGLVGGQLHGEVVLQAGHHLHAGMSELGGKLSLEVKETYLLLGFDDAETRVGAWVLGVDRE